MVVSNEQGRHVRLVHPDSDTKARDSRLRDLENRLADPVAIPDADLVIAQAIDGEVFAELAVREVVASEMLRPVLVGVELVDEDGSVLAPVTDLVGLFVAATLRRTLTRPVTGRCPLPCERFVLPTGCREAVRG